MTVVTKAVEDVAGNPDFTVWRFGSDLSLASDDVTIKSSRVVSVIPDSVDGKAVVWVDLDPGTVAVEYRGITTIIEVPDSDKPQDLLELLDAGSFIAGGEGFTPSAAHRGSPVDDVTDDGDGGAEFWVLGNSIGTMPMPGATASNIAGSGTTGVEVLEAETPVLAQNAIGIPDAVPAIGGSRLQADPTGSGYGPSFIAGYYDVNVVASDLAAATIGGGGSVGRENVIGGDGSVTVNTATTNEAETGTSAHYSIIPGGYDNVAGGLASVVVGYHNYTALGSTHGTIAGGSVNSITKPGATNDYATIGGGTANTASASGSTVAGGNTNTASGSGAVISGGYTSVASGVASTVSGGQYHVASGTASTVVGGRENTASGAESTAVGREVLADLLGELGHASGKFATQGDAQVRRFVGRNTTTDATATNMYLNGSVTNPRIPEDSTWFLTAKVAARRTDVDGESAAYRLEACMDRNAGSTGALVGTVTKVVVGEDTAAWDVSLSVNTSGTINVQGIGEAGKTIQWVALIEAVQVTG